MVLYSEIDFSENGEVSVLYINIDFSENGVVSVLYSEIDMKVSAMDSKEGGYNVFTTLI